MYLLSASWGLGIIISWYSAMYYQDHIELTKIIIQELKQEEEANRMFLQTSNYNKVNELDSYRRQEDVWRQRLLHQLENEPVRLARIDDKEDSLILEVIGNYIDILNWLDKVMKDIPYIRLIPQEINYDIGGCKWLLKASI